MDIKGVNLEFLGHSGFLISKGNKKIAIDPYNISTAVPKVDIILITHSHYDHCSIKDIQKISDENTTVVLPADAQSKITKVDNIKMQVIESGDSLEIGAIKIETVPAYNIDKDFHPKSEGWFGYLIKVNGTIIYHAGDTDKIPEISKLSGYGKHDNFFVAILPVSGKYVMNAEEAAELASILNPDLAIPMHFGAGVAGTQEDAETFVKLCKEKNLNAQILEKI